MPCNFSVSSRNEGQRGLLRTQRNLYWDIIANQHCTNYTSIVYSSIVHSSDYYYELPVAAITAP